VKFLSGKKIGNIEEWFIAQLEPGDTFWFGGKSLELVRIKEMSVQVKKSKRKSGKVPSWMGGRMPLSSMLAKQLRRKFTDYAKGIVNEIELEVLTPLFEKQREVSHLPKEDEFLIEYFETSEGFHLLLYPFEGRFVHEGIGALIASRISRQLSISFSIAMNDYGLELLSDKKLDIDKLINNELFSTKNLFEDIQKSINSIEMARRKFRDIAKISGLIFQGFPGKKKKERHLQSSSSLLFDVFKEYDPNNLLFSQTFEEVLTFQLEETRLRSALQRIQGQKLIISQPTPYSPFSFPIIVDRLNREKISSESISDRVAKLKAELGL
jgi:ATP-dependent Lhr-like helicase